ncbi:MAG TPA: oxidoreductase [Anaeromyxobacteraceae bacterium]|nr:oxidoreductase [Anaeromyxobacteraceae bacterium]
MAAWTFDNIPDQTGRKALVTGANSGIGLETAGALAKKGAHVTLACRSRDKGEAAMSDIRASTPRARLDLQLLDLADLLDVASFAERFRAANDRLDLLVCNAGVMTPPASKTKQGFELQLGVNHLAHFALTGALLPLLQASQAGRVVAVSSTGAAIGKMDFDDLNFERRGYAAVRAYGQSKLANQLFVRELSRRLRASGSKVLVTAAHPGWTSTNLQRTNWWIRAFNPIFGMKPAQGALPSLRAATDPNAKGADYFGPDGLFQMRGYPKPVPMLERAMNDDAAARLWRVSEELTGVHYGLPA